MAKEGKNALLRLPSGEMRYINAECKATIGEVGNARCGDIMQIFLKIDNDVITDIKFQTFGCGAAIASTSMGTEMVKDKTIEDALKIKNSDVLNELGGLPKEKIHCSVLFEEVLKDAISKYKESK